MLVRAPDAEQETELDEYEVRSATVWYCYMTLALLAAIRATTLPDGAPPGKKRPRAVWWPSGGGCGRRASCPPHDDGLGAGDGLGQVCGDDTGSGPP